jgi:hypothetical protein
MSVIKLSDLKDKPRISDVQRVMKEHFPEYCSAVEAGLATIATLLLKDNANPATLFYYGNPSTGKTTVIDIFSGHPITYRSDDFTPASFVSHKADLSEKQLEKVDLLPRIKYKALLTPEMAATFSGREDILRARLAVMTRVLDGQGLLSDSGAHGRRGYGGDYLISWIGATVPIRANVWDIMSNMGSRMLFWPMPELTLTTEELVQSQEGIPYKDRLEACNKAALAFLSALFGADLEKAIRSVTWDTSKDPQEVKLRIGRLAELLSALRSKEAAFRAFAMLTNFARGHALIHGRKQLSDADFPLTAQLAVGSIPDDTRQVFTALIRCGGIMSVKVAAAAMGCSYPTAQSKMRACNGAVMKFVEKPVAHVELREEWEWCMLLKDLLGGPLNLDIKSPLLEAYAKLALNKAKKAGEEHLVPAEWRDGFRA